MTTTRTGSLGSPTTRMIFHSCTLFAALFCAAPAVHAVEKSALRVGVFNNRPIVFETAPGQYAGLSIDVLESVAGQENWEIDYVFAPWKEITARLENGDLDLVVGIAYDEERAQRYDYTQETLINNWGTVFRSPGTKISSLADLRDKRVALVSGSIHSLAFEDIMSRFGFAFEALPVEHYRDGMQAAQNGEVDAAVLNRVISLLHADDYELLETGIIFNPVEVRYATLKDRGGAILSAIDKHLSLQKQDKSSIYYQSLNHWLYSRMKAGLPPWLLTAGAAATLIVLILAVSNLLIRKQVAARTKELSESELRFRQLAENIKEIFWIGSPDWRQVHYVSPAFESIWNKSREALYAEPLMWLDSIHPDDRDRVIEDMERKSKGDLAVAAFPEYRIINDSGLRWILARAYPILDKKGRVIRIAGIAEDITERKQAYETIDFMAHHDPLTRLSNRYAFEITLDKLIQETDWQHHHHALMYIDLDQFKIINDTCGHAAGDRMLVALARLLLATVSNRGILARLGGDEFGLILQDTTQNDAHAVARQLLDAIKDFRFDWNEQRFSVGASIGLVFINSSDRSRSDLLSAADMACYAAKDRGRNRLHVYTPHDAELLQRHGEMQWVNRLKAALEDDRFVLHKQSIRPLQSGQKHPPCDEYLFRMVDEEGELILPGAFIPAAERYELMPQLDRWVVRNVIAHLKSCEVQAERDATQPVAFVNLSGQIFTDDHFVEFLMDELTRNRINPRCICLEITETAAISNLDKAIEFINQLRDKGLNFALDDFGSGMSSFSYIKSLPVDYLKIDGVFIKDLLADPMNIAIVEAITRIGHTAELKVIAEWVENESILAKLAEMGIDFAQGYAIDKPAAISTPRLNVAGAR